MRLTINMMARTDLWFSNFLLRVGDGVEEVIEEDYVQILDDMTILYTDEKASKDALINEIFPANLDSANRLCNGTRLICKCFDPNVIDAEIIVGQHAGNRVLFPRIPLASSEEDMFPFKLKRTQFPIRLSFAMTINKAQGQTIPNVGVYFPDSIFSHDQLYVALSRGISRATTK
ncbi:ATP-dependent DNA helicase PIF1-like protein, partial [Tanacetum coccineum]